MGAGLVSKTEDGKKGSWKGRRCGDFECGVEGLSVSQLSPEGKRQGGGGEAGKGPVQVEYEGKEERAKI